MSCAYLGSVNPNDVQLIFILIFTRLRDRRLLIICFFFSFRSLLGGPTAGALLARDRGSFSPMIIFAGTTVMIGSLFILASKLVINKRVLARV